MRFILHLHLHCGGVERGEGARPDICRAEFGILDKSQDEEEGYFFFFFFFLNTQNLIIILDIINF